MSETMLNTLTHAEITLADALSNCAVLLEQAIALVYSPSACCFAKQENGQLLDQENQPISLANIFEARVFNATHELRWLKHSQDFGRAVFISENSLVEMESWKELEPLTFLEKIDQQYLLWGEGINSTLPDGWGKLATARIGKLAVPIADITANKPVYLKSCEYLQVVDNLYGNVAVAEERLVGLSLIPLVSLQKTES